MPGHQSCSSLSRRRTSSCFGLCGSGAGLATAAGGETRLPEDRAEGLGLRVRALLRVAGTVLRGAGGATAAASAIAADWIGCGRAGLTGPSPFTTPGGPLGSPVYRLTST